MGYRNLQVCVRDLERTGQLVRISAEIDPHLEMAEIQRRIYRAQGPALWFERVKGTRFPMVGNLYRTLGSKRFFFPHTNGFLLFAQKGARLLQAARPRFSAAAAGNRP